MITENTIFHYAQTNSADVLIACQTSLQSGLSENEAVKRLKELGTNTIHSDKSTNVLFDVLQHLKSPLMIILLAATSISFALGETVNASIIFVMVILSVGIDYYLERDARNAADKLKKLVQNKVSVLRGVLSKILRLKT
jgi:magnesium-transporting ATPase (P-type)